MIQACFRVGLTALISAALLLPQAASAALVADPAVLYQQMKAAYDKGAAGGWTFRDQQYYLSTIFNAGRAYSLQRPNDPAYGQLAQLTVDIATGLHYNPLTNHDAVPWYVREASNFVIKSSADATESAKAKALLERIDALEDPTREAQLADEDATANLRTYSRDPDAELEQLEADWRSWVLTKDPSYRTLAFQRAARPYFPVSQIPPTYGADFIAAARAAATGNPAYAQGDAVNAKVFVDRLDTSGKLENIASVRAMPHDAYLTTLAPADEYFGQLGMSVLGMRNELHRINLYLDYKYGDRESNAAVFLAQSVDDLHKVYPRDRDLPDLLYQTYTTLGRISTTTAQAAALKMKTILTIEYQDTSQARRLLGET
ncbi:MAG: hypothetical protein M3Y21_02585 [Candidatus Eremiobacteraeota bacterium]|nr:hypothetical protein [Candidatus Eremiobacteraeota bacterium]